MLQMQRHPSFHVITTLLFTVASGDAGRLVGLMSIIIILAVPVLCSSKRHCGNEGYIQQYNSSLPIAFYYYRHAAFLVVLCGVLCITIFCTPVVFSIEMIYRTAYLIQLCKEEEVSHRFLLEIQKFLIVSCMEMQILLP